jgi:hypothetical protein
MQIYLPTHGFKKPGERTFFVGVYLHMLLHNNNVSGSFDDVYKGKQIFIFSSLVLTESSLYPYNSRMLLGAIQFLPSRRKKK